MDERPIDVIMPGAEGEWLVRALRDAGVEARRSRVHGRAAESPPRLLVVSVGAEEDPAALLRDLSGEGEQERPPIILVGGSQVGLEWARELGVASFMQRPVTIARLVEEVLRLSAPGVEGSAEGSAVITARRPSKRPGAGALRVHDTVVSAPPGQKVVRASNDPRFSARLRELFARADRALFPDQPALELLEKSKRHGVELTAAELVPDEILMPRRESPDEEAFDELPGDDTIVGGHPSLRSSASARPPTFSEEGRLVEAGVVALFHRLATGSGNHGVLLELPGGEAIELTISEGRITRFDGPVALALWTRLRDEAGLGGPLPPDEPAAHRMLEAEVEEGRIDRYELERGLRLGREALLHRVVGASEVRYRLGGAEAVVGGRSRLLAADILPSIFEGMRRGVSSEDAKRWLGGGDRSIVLLPETRSRLVDAGIPPELAAYVERHDGAALADAMDGLDPSEGVAGLLVALHRTEALDVGPEVRRRASIARRDSRARLVARHRRALDADYFTLLGLTRDASDRDVEAAYREQRADLEAISLGERPGPDLERIRDACLDALVEAHEVLRDAATRRAYAAALA